RGMCACSPGRESRGGTVGAAVGGGHRARGQCQLLAPPAPTEEPGTSAPVPAQAAHRPHPRWNQSRRGSGRSQGMEGGRKGQKGAERGRKGQKGAERGRKGQKGAERGRKGQKGAERGRKGQKGAERGRKGQKGAERGRKGQKGAERALPSRLQPPEPLVALSCQSSVNHLRRCSGHSPWQLLGHRQGSAQGPAAGEQHPCPPP
uniref:Uncharacterized protein n=1 Tax=Ficedula albicollis TaxID=59894 RepID=A0A803VHP4_FICAL